MATCAECGAKIGLLAPHCEACTARYAEQVRADGAAVAVPAPPAQSPDAGVVLTDIRIGFGRWVEIVFAVTFAAIPAGVVLGIVAWGTFAFLRLFIGIASN